MKDLGEAESANGFETPRRRAARATLDNLWQRFGAARIPQAELAATVAAVTDLITAVPEPPWEAIVRAEPDPDDSLPDLYGRKLLAVWDTHRNDRFFGVHVLARVFFATTNPFVRFACCLYLEFIRNRQPEDEFETGLLRSIDRLSADSMICAWNLRADARRRSLPRAEAMDAGPMEPLWAAMISQGVVSIADDRMRYADGREEIFAPRLEIYRNWPFGLLVEVRTAFATKWADVDDRELDRRESTRCALLEIALDRAKGLDERLLALDYAVVALFAGACRGQAAKAPNVKFDGWEREFARRIRAELADCMTLDRDAVARFVERTKENAGNLELLEILLRMSFDEPKTELPVPAEAPAPAELAAPTEAPVPAEAPTPAELAAPTEAPVPAEIPSGPPLPVSLPTLPDVQATSSPRALRGAFGVGIALTVVCLLLFKSTRQTHALRVGEVATGPTQTTLTSTRDPHPGPPPAQTVSPEIETVAVGRDLRCALMSDRSVRCRMRPDQPPYTVPGLGATVRLVARDGAACATNEQGEHRCWGHLEWLGEGDAHGEETAPQFLDITGGQVVAPVEGMNGPGTMPLIVSPDGVVRGVGIGGAASGFGPEVAFARPVLQADQGPYAICAVLADRTVGCRRDYDSSQPSLTVPVTGVAAAREVRLGRGHGCALLDGGRVRCWATCNYGEGDEVGTPGCRVLERPRAGSRLRSSPVRLGGTATALTAFHDGACASLADGTAQCWRMGPRGPGAPRPVAGLGRVRALAGAGSSGTGVCALQDGGAVRCWSHDGAEPTPVAF